MTMRNMLPWKRGGEAVPARDARNGSAVVRDPIEAFFHETDRWFTDAWPAVPALVQNRAAGGVPRMDVVDTGGAYQVTIELPGVEETDVDLTIDGSTLVVKGEKRAQQRAEGEGWVHSERAFGAFRRAIELPCEVDASGAQAELEHGLLSITLPKSEKAKPRRIEVRRG